MGLSVGQAAIELCKLHGKKPSGRELMVIIHIVLKVRREPPWDSWSNLQKAKSDW